MRTPVGARRRVRDPDTDGDRARRARRGHLDDAELFVGLVVHVQCEAGVLDVELLRPVDVRDGKSTMQPPSCVGLIPPLRRTSSASRTITSADLSCRRDVVRYGVELGLGAVRRGRPSLPRARRSGHAAADPSAADVDDRGLALQEPAMSTSLGSLSPMFQEVKRRPARKVIAGPVSR